MESRTEIELPQEGTRREAGESLPEIDLPANAGELVSGCPTVSGGGTELRERDVRGLTAADDIGDLVADSRSEIEPAFLQDVVGDSRKRSRVVMDSDDELSDCDSVLSSASRPKIGSSRRGRSKTGIAIGLGSARQELNWQNLHAFERQCDEEIRFSPIGGADIRESRVLRDMETAGMELPPASPPLRPPKGLRSKPPPKLEGPSEEEIEMATRVKVPWESSLGGPSAEECHQVGILCAEAIREVSRKSNNIKGTLRGTLNNASTTMRRVMSNLTSRTVTSETHKLQADNDRLQREMSELRAEVDTLRKTVGRRRSTEVPPNISGDHQIMAAFEELKRSLSISIGAINTRLDGLDNLGPDRAQARPRTHAVPARGRRVEFPPLRTTNVDATPARHLRATLTEPSLEETGDAPFTTSPRPSTSRASVPSAPMYDAWADVAKRGKRTRRGKRQEPPVGAQSARPQSKTSQAPPAPRPPLPKRVRIRTPRSHAIVIQLRAEAIEKGVTYKKALLKVLEDVNLEEIGIVGGIRIRTSATGARLMEVSGADSLKKADDLAHLLQESISEIATITRPVKSADVRISGLSEVATQEAVAAAIVKVAGCSLQQVKVGGIRVGPSGVGATIVNCPAIVARKLVATGKVLVCWHMAQVAALEPRPLRCFRCMGVGHTRSLCPSRQLTEPVYATGVVKRGTKMPTVRRKRPNVLSVQRQNGLMAT